MNFSVRFVTRKLGRETEEYSRNPTEIKLNRDCSVVHRTITEISGFRSDRRWLEKTMQAPTHHMAIEC